MPLETKHYGVCTGCAMTSDPDRGFCDSCHDHLNVIELPLDPRKLVMLLERRCPECETEFQDWTMDEENDDELVFAHFDPMEGSNEHEDTAHCFVTREEIAIYIALAM